MEERFNVYGHENLTAKHKTTIAFTPDNYLTKEGDCFLGSESKKLSEFPEKFKKLAKNKKMKIIIEIKVGNLKEKITGYGHPDLTFSDKDIVIRKSDFVDGRTLCIKADKAAIDLNRELINKLKNSKQKAEVVISLKGLTAL